MKSTATIKEVSTTPEVTLNKEELITIFIDPEMTDGGITINGKLLVGKIKVTESQATDYLRMQDEYFETKKKLIDKNVVVRMKSDFQKERLFLADPKEHAGRQGFSRDYGLLGAKEWSYCAPLFKERLLEQRQALYGY